MSVCVCVSVCAPRIPDTHTDTRGHTHGHTQSCRLDLAKFCLETSLTHRQYRRMRILFDKYIPLESLEGGLEHPCASLLHLPKTKVTLERTVDRLIEGEGRGVFQEVDVPVFCLEREISAKTTKFRYRDVMEAIIELFALIDPDTLEFEAQTGPPFGHYRTSEQYAYFAQRV